MFQIGIASRGIVPDRPAMVMGQMHVRIAHAARDPITVTAMAMSGNRPDGTPDRAVLVSMDMALIDAILEAGVRKIVAASIPELPPENIVLAVTHTHESVVPIEGAYPTQAPEIMTPTECNAFVAQRTAEAIIEAWRGLAPVRIARGFGHAVIAHNRRPVYADGSARMYGNPAQKEFRWIEGPEDHTVDFFFVWDASGKLQGVVIDVPCPSQIDEQLNAWSADFWHEVRLEIQARLGAGIWVFPLCGAAGDQSPHPVFDKAQEAELLKRRGVTERQEIADRICDAVERALKYAKPIEGDVVFAHDYRKTTFAPRIASRRERDWHENEYKSAIRHMDPRLWWPKRLKDVVDIFDGKITPTPFDAEIHVFRIADAVLATNPFELYTDYGLQIKARSAAAQTFLAQLTGPAGLYLPTQRGVDGGGYGSIPVVSIVGPEGGQELVEMTLEMIGKMFAEGAAK